MLKVLIDTSPLKNGHAIRGVGQYTKNLLQSLQQIPELKIVTQFQTKLKGEFPEVIHYPFFDLFYPSLPLWRKAPTVVTIHDVIPLVFKKYYPAGKKGTINLWRQKFALKTVSAVITDSEISAVDIAKYLNVPSKKIFVVPLAANPFLEVASKTLIKQVMQKYDLPKKYLLYVGDINYNKNLPQLIKMLKFLPSEISLVCVGKNFYPHDIPEWRWLEAQMALSDVTERVKMITSVGANDTDDLAAIYTGALAYIQPSLYEGFGLPVLEAMQCQTPVIAAQTGSLPEVGGELALYSEPVAEAMAEKVLMVIAWSEDYRNQWLKKAAAWSQTFSWEKAARKTIAVYQTVAKPKS